VVTFKRLDGSQLMKHILVLQQICSILVEYGRFLHKTERGRR